MAAQNGGKSLKWALVVTALAVIVAATVWLAQWLIADAMRKALEEEATLQGYSLQIENIHYSLWGSRLVVNGVEATSSRSGMNNISLGFAELQGLNRTLAFKAMLGEDVFPGGTIPLAQHVLCRDFRIWPSPEVQIREQTIEALSLDSDRLKALLAQPDKAGTDTKARLQQFSSAVVYTASFSKDIRILMEINPGVPFAIDIAEQRNEGVSKGHIVRSSASGLRFMEGNDNKETLGIDRIVFNEIFISESTLDMLAAQKNDASLSREMAKSLFFGERPLLAQADVEGVRMNIEGVPVTLGALRWKNPQTAPFSCTLLEEHLKMPLTLFPELGYLSLMGLQELDLDIAFSGLFQPVGGQNPTETRLDTTVRGLGMLSIGSRYFIDQPIALDELFQDKKTNQSIRVQTLQVSFTEGGLLGRIARVGGRLFGLKPENMAESLRELAWKSLPAESHTPKTSEQLNQIETFLRQPGSITFSITPPEPVQLGELEDVADRFLTIDGKKGPKTLQELSVQ